MSYGVSFAREAELDLDRLKDPLLKSHVLDQLDLLARAPAKLSRPASFPHLPFQKYQFWSPDHAIHFTALFQYSQDEQTLIILAIGAIRY